MGIPNDVFTTRFIKIGGNAYHRWFVVRASSDGLIAADSYYQLAVKNGSHYHHRFVLPIGGASSSSPAVGVTCCWLDESYNFVVDNFFIRSHLWSQMSIQSPKILKLKFYK